MIVEDYMARVEESLQSLADELGLTVAERRDAFARVTWLAQKLRDEAHEGCLALDALHGAAAMSRDVVFAEPIEGLKDRWLVTLSCGHKKHVANKLASYSCNECGGSK